MTNAAPTDDDDDDDELDEDDEALDISDWYSIAEAEQQSGVPRRTILRLAKAGKIRRATDETGHYRYDPEGVTDAVVRPVGAPPRGAAPSAEAIEESFKGGASLLKQAHHHLERVIHLSESMFTRAGVIMDSANAAYKEANLTLQSENKEIRARCSQLEEGYWAAINAREQALNDSHVRDLEIKVEADREARKDRMAKVFEERAPELLAKLLGTDPSDLAKAALAVEFLKSFPPAMVEMMLEGDFLNEKQKAMLAKLLGREPPKATETKETVETTGSTVTETTTTEPTKPETKETVETTGSTVTETTKPETSA